MNVREALLALSSQGLELARLALEGRLGDCGLDPSQLRSYKAVGIVLYGPCRQKKIRSAFLDVAADFSIARLIIIHKAAGQLSRRAPITRWELRLELGRLRELSLEELAQHAKARVRELNAASGTRPVRSLVISADADATGRRTAVLKLPETEMASLERKLRAMKTSGPDDVAMGNAMWTLLTTGRGVAVKGLEPTVLLMAEDLEGRGGSMLQATDGTQIDATDYLENQLGQYGWVLLYDKLAQPVNLWRISRFANDKQRAIIAADQGQCAWPGCRRTAIYGQAHHIHDWKDGGYTNLDNLMGLCGPHNAMNGGKNGRMARDHDGYPIWIPPDGGPPVRNRGYHTTRSGRARMITAKRNAPALE